MFVCMTDMQPGPFELGEDEIERQRAYARATALGRLEAIWKLVEQQLDPELGADPRWAEIGLRVLDREARLFRFDRAPKDDQDDEDPAIQGVDRGALVLEQLAELERSVRAARGEPVEGV
jgi:hypothetical protein